MCWFWKGLISIAAVRPAAKSADNAFFGSDVPAQARAIATWDPTLALDALLGQLDARQFWQVHRSPLINLAHLAGTRRDEASRLFLRFKGLTTELPVSRAYVPLFKAM